MFTDQQKSALTIVCDAALKQGGIQTYNAVAILLQMVNVPAVPPAGALPAQPPAAAPTNGAA